MIKKLIIFSFLLLSTASIYLAYGRMQGGVIMMGASTPVSSTTTVAASSTTTTTVSGGSIGENTYDATADIPHPPDAIISVQSADTAGDISYGHVYISSCGTATTVCLQLMENADGGTLHAYGTASCSTGWLNIPLNTTYNMAAGTYRLVIQHNGTSVLQIHMGAYSSGDPVESNNPDWTSYVSCTTKRTLGAEFSARWPRMVFNNSSGDPT